MLIDQALRHHARYRGGRVALSFDGRETSFAELDAQANRCANMLAGLGVGPGGRVAVITENCPEFAVLLFGAARLGAVLVPLNYRLAIPELLEIMESCAPAVLVGESRYLEALLDAAPDLERRCRLLSIDRPPTGIAAFAQALGAASDGFADAARDPDMPVFLQYTSGTTGRPKGVFSTHRAWAQISLIEPPLKGIGLDSNYLAVMPMCHTGGAKWVVQVLFAGARLTISRRFEARSCLAAIARERATNMTLAPTMLYQLLDAYRPGADDLSSLAFINYGGGTMSERRLLEAIELIGCAFTQGYGMTELAGGSVTFSGPADHVAGGKLSPRMASAGRPLIDCEVRLIDGNGSQLPAGEVGEVIVRSDRVTPRYCGHDASPVDAEGFYHTGDLARADEDGYITIVDRAKDMIVSGGLNIYSREVEDVLIRHPAVAEAHVVGVPDEAWGESVKAVVVLRPGASPNAEELRDWCRRHLASYKKPSTVVFAAAEQLPRTSLGKVMKRALRAL